MRPNIKHALVETLAATIAIVSGIAIFYLIFAWPVLVGSDLMLAWGWIGWIPGLLFGYRSGGVVRAYIRRRFDVSTDVLPVVPDVPNISPRSTVSDAPAASPLPAERGLVVEALAVVAALVIGAAIFWITFSSIAWVIGRESMNSWAFVVAFVAMGVGYFGGGRARWYVRRTSTITSNQSRKG